jgi:hypothetical protein
MADLNFLPATEIAALVRDRKVSPVEVGVPGASSRKCTVRVRTEERAASAYNSFIRENNRFGG